MPSARRKPPVGGRTTTPSQNTWNHGYTQERPAYVPGHMNIGQISDVSGKLRVKSVGIGSGQYNEYTTLLAEGYDKGTALITVCPDISDEDILFMTTGIMPEEV